MEEIISSAISEHRAPYHRRYFRTEASLSLSSRSFVRGRARDNELSPSPPRDCTLHRAIRAIRAKELPPFL